MNRRDGWSGVLALAVATLALLATAPRLARAADSAPGVQNEVPVPGAAPPEGATKPEVTAEAVHATSLGAWWADQPWRFNVNVYGWLPQAPVDIRVANVEASAPERFSNILDDLDLAAMAEFELHKGPMGVFVSPIYYDGKDTEHVQGLFERRKFTLKESVWLIDYGLSYAFGPWPLWEGADSPTATLEPFVGGRFLHDHINLNVDPGLIELQPRGSRDRVVVDPDILERQARTSRGRALLERGIIELPGTIERPGGRRIRRQLRVDRGVIRLEEDIKKLQGDRRRVSFDPRQSRTTTSLVRTSIDFNTPIVGLRSRWDLTKRWTLFLAGDGGGFHVDGVRSTYQGVGTIGYRFKMGHVSSKVFVGYRYLHVRYEKDVLRIKVNIKGPLFGIGFEF